MEQNPVERILFVVVAVMLGTLVLAGFDAIFYQEKICGSYQIEKAK